LAELLVEAALMNEPPETKFRGLRIVEVGYIRQLRDPQCWDCFTQLWAGYGSLPYRRSFNPKLD
jgi:hypothetical protein